jgi:hypothetical protein
MFPVEIGVQRSSALDIEVEIWFPDSTECYAFHLETPYRAFIHTDYPWKEDVPCRNWGPEVKCTGH